MTPIVSSLLLLLLVLFGLAVMVGIAGKGPVKRFFLGAGLLLVALLVLPALLAPTFQRLLATFQGAFSGCSPTLPSVSPGGAPAAPDLGLLWWYLAYLAGIGGIWLVGWVVEGQE